MEIEKVLNKIHTEIKALQKGFEAFADGSVQPGSEECINIQNSLNALNEQLSVYKYLKQHKEISPNYHLHVKVSEHITPEIINDTQNEIALTPQTPSTNSSHKEENPQTKKVEFKIGINDKFRFINDLFNQSQVEFNVAVEQINNLQHLDEANNYLNALSKLYNWKAQSETTQHFSQLVRNAFKG